MSRVQVIGAKWCAKCPAVKQSVVDWCALVGLVPEMLDYDELEETDADLHASVSTLPTVRVCAPSASWQVFCGKNFLDACRSAILSLPSVAIGDAEF